MPRLLTTSTAQAPKPGCSGGYSRPHTSGRRFAAAVLALIGLWLLVGLRPDAHAADGLWGYVIGAAASTFAALLILLEEHSRGWWSASVPLANALMFGLSPIARFYWGADGDAFPASSHMPAAGVAYIFTAVFLLANEFTRSPWAHCYEPASLVGALACRYRLMINTALVVLPILLFAEHLRQFGGGAFLQGLSAHLGGRTVRVYDVSTTQYFSAAPIAHVAVAAAIVLNARPSQNRAFISISAGALLLLPVLAFLPQGQRRFLLPSIVIVAVARRVRFGPMPKILFSLTIGILICLLYIVPQYRTAGARSQTGLGDLIWTTVSSPGQLVSSVLTGTDTSMINSFGYAIEQDFGGQGDFTTLLDPVTAPIPSSLLPRQNGHDAALEFVQGTTCRFAGAGRCPDFSAPGSFYFDFGVLGGVLGGLAFFAVYRSVAKSVFHATSSPQFASPVAGVLAFVTFRAGFGEGVVWTMMFIVPLVVATRVASLKHDGSPRGSTQWRTGQPTLKSDRPVYPPRKLPQPPSPVPALRRPP